MSFEQARQALNHLFHRRADVGLELAAPVTMEGMLALVASLVDILNGSTSDRPIWQRRFEPLVFKDQMPSEPIRPFVAVICNELRFEALASRQEVWTRLARSGEDMSNWSRSPSLVHESATLVLLCTPGVFEDPTILPSLQTAYTRDIPILPAIVRCLGWAEGWAESLPEPWRASPSPPRIPRQPSERGLLWPPSSPPSTAPSAPTSKQSSSGAHAPPAQPKCTQIVSSKSGNSL